MSNTIHFVVHNIAGEKEGQTEDQRRVAGKTAIFKCVGGAGILNEINLKDVAFFRKYLRSNGLLWKRRGQVAIVYDPERILLHAFGFRKIMDGGLVGADGVHGRGDDRRVGPDRYMLKFKGEVLTARGPNFKIMFLGTHMMAKSDTQHKWRRALFNRSVRNAGRYIRRSLKNYPNGVIAGDLNKIKFVDWPFVNEKPVETKPDMGKARYTQVFTFGRVRAVNIREFQTPSDHDGSEMDLILLSG